MIKYLKTHYDYVIVDTPPANLVIDAVLIAKNCDATIVVVESGSTDSREAARLVKLLENAQIKILGIVLNKTSFGKKTIWLWKIWL